MPIKRKNNWLLNKLFDEYDNSVYIFKDSSTLHFFLHSQPDIPGFYSMNKFEYY